MKDFRLLVKASLIPDNAYVKKVTGTYVYKFVRQLTVDHRTIIPQKGCGFLLPKEGVSSDNIYSISADTFLEVLFNTTEEAADFLYNHVESQ